MESQIDSFIAFLQNVKNEYNNSVNTINNQKQIIDELKYEVESFGKVSMIKHLNDTIDSIKKENIFLKESNLKYKHTNSIK